MRALVVLCILELLVLFIRHVLLTSWNFYAYFHMPMHYLSNYLLLHLWNAEATATTTFKTINSFQCLTIVSRRAMLKLVFSFCLVYFCFLLKHWLKIRYMIETSKH